MSGQPQNPAPSTAALDAATRGDAAALRDLIFPLTDVDARDNNSGDSLLHIAVRGGHTDCVAVLLAAGANPALRTPMDTADNANAYHLAARGGHADILRQLLQHRSHAAIYATVPTGKAEANALHLALLSGDVDTVRVMIDHGADINHRDSQKQTPLHWILQHRTSRSEALPVIRLLLDHGADNEKALNHWGETPLMAAAKGDFPEAMALLLSRGADATRTSYFEETPLHFAAHHYTVATIRLLLDAGAAIDAPDRNGQTALHIAAHHNRRDVVKTLLAADANPLLTDKRGRTPDALCLAPVQETTRFLVLQKQEEVKKRPVLRGRFNTPARGQRPFAQKPSSKRFGNRP